MKKFTAILPALVLALGLAACGSTAAASDPAAPAAVETPTAAAAATETPAAPETTLAPAEPTEEPASEDETASALVLYFSHTGTTEGVALEIAAQTGADVFELVPQTPYTDDYNTLLEVAQGEKQDAARPAFTGEIEGFEDYDTVYVGFPNWWADMPMILYTMFDAYDFSGKTIVPFVTSGGSGFSGALRTMAELEPDALILDGLSLGGSAAATPTDAVAEWLSGLGLAD